MNTASKPSGLLERSTIVRAGRWLCRWRNLRKLLITLASLVTLIALAYSLDTWTSKRAWEQYKHEMEAKGEHLDLAAFVPKPVPDDQNFTMTPFLAPLYDFKPGTQQWRDTNAYQRTLDFANDWAILSESGWGMWTNLPLTLKTRPAPTAGSPHPRPVEVKYDNPKAAAAAILKDYRKYAPVLDEIRAASRRPYSRFNVHYENEDPAAILLPHLAVMKKLCQILRLRAQAEVTLGQTEAALKDLELTLYLADSFKNEPTLISHLVRLACVQIAIPAIWHGLADRQWSDAQLQALQKRLQAFDLLADMNFELRGERAFGNAIIELIRNKPDMLPRIGAPDSPSPSGFGRVVLELTPRGWFYQEQLNYNREYQQTVLAGFDTAARRFYPEQDEAHMRALEESLRDKFAVLWHHRIMTGMLLPSLTKVHLRSAYTATVVDEALVACALERYRQANSQFPETLEALAPRFLDKLPHDLIGGAPLHYRRTSDGQFILYSIGWNHSDDGGQVALTKGMRPAINLTQGDWVWRYPSKQ